MFAEDASTEIWSHFDRKSGNNGPIICLEDCSDHLAELLTKAIPGGRGYHRGLPESLANSTKMISKELILHGYINFELSFGFESQELTGEPRDLNLRYIPHGSLLRVLGSYYQVLPKDIQEDEQHKTRRVDRDRIISFKPHSKLKRSLRRLRTTIPAISKSESVDAAIGRESK